MHRLYARYPGAAAGTHALAGILICCVRCGFRELGDGRSCRSVTS
jgi:hypothetical protein